MASNRSSQKGLYYCFYPSLLNGQPPLSGHYLISRGWQCSKDWSVVTKHTLAFSCKQTRRAKLFPLGISGHRRVMSSAQSDWSSSNLCLLPANLSLPESSFFDSWFFELVSAERKIENRRVLYYTSITLTENAGNRIKWSKFKWRIDNSILWTT